MMPYFVAVACASLVLIVVYTSRLYLAPHWASLVSSTEVNNVKSARSEFGSDTPHGMRNLHREEGKENTLPENMRPNPTNVSGKVSIHINTICKFLWRKINSG